MGGRILVLLRIKLWVKHLKEKSKANVKEELAED